VNFKISYTWIHNHTVAVSTWTHAEHVKKNGYLTSKQLLKNVANTKISRPLLQTSENSKTAPPT
jgi:hypothetical protein